jgi:hypothetical protein
LAPLFADGGSKVDVGGIQIQLPLRGDGFDNKITVHAYANPESPSSGGGYGLIRFKKKTNEVTFECWPRDVDVSKPGAKQFVGWPKTIKLAE